MGKMNVTERRLGSNELATDIGWILCIMCQTLEAFLDYSV